MRIILIIIGILAGIAIAFGLNFLLVKKIENKGYKIGMQITAYIVCIMLSFLFIAIFSLRYTLDKFIDNRINDMELVLSRKFPNTEFLEMTFDTSEIVSLNNELQQSLSGIDTDNDSIFERMVYDAFLSEITKYTNVVDYGVNTLASISNNDGTITIMALLLGIKKLALDTVSPYFFILQVIIMVVFFIFIGIFTGVSVYIKKGGGTYNKSIVYGNNQS
jgi:hypothetical protein